MDKSSIGFHSIRMFIWSLAYRIMCIVVSTSLIAIYSGTDFLFRNYTCFTLSANL